LKLTKKNERQHVKTRKKTNNKHQASKQERKYVNLQTMLGANKHQNRKESMQTDKKGKKQANKKH
jgi:hypothetical protein